MKDEIEITARDHEWREALSRELQIGGAISITDDKWVREKSTYPERFARVVKLAVDSAVAALQGRLFPVLGAGFSIPWRYVAPYEAQAKRNHDQTLEELARRGGLGVEEILCCIDGLSWFEAKRNGAAPTYTRERLLAWVREREGLDVAAAQLKVKRLREVLEQVSRQCDQRCASLIERGDDLERAPYVCDCGRGDVLRVLKETALNTTPTGSDNGR